MSLPFYHFTVWTDKCPGGIHDLDEWGVPRIIGHVFSSIH
jgi:hypothetical protein